jgi:hypothetical protein
MELPRRLTWSLLALVVVAFSLRLAAGWWWQSRLPDGERFRFGDSQSYWVLGQCFYRGEPYEYGADNRVFRTPGYPALLAALFWILGTDNPPVIWARALSAWCGTLAVLGVVWLAAQWFGWRGGLAAGWIAAIHPEAIALGTFVLSEAPFCPLMLLQLNAWQAAAAANSRWTSSGPVWSWSVVAGVAAGLATLMRPSWLLFTPLAMMGAMIGTAWRSKFRRPENSTAHHRAESATPSLITRLTAQLPIAIATVAGLVITLAPWWYRNYVLTGEFVLTSLQVGASLYDGINPQATGASDMHFVRPAIERLRSLDAQAAVPPTASFEVRLDRYLRDESLGWAREHPREVLQLAGIKLVRMWNLWPNANEMGGRVGRWVVTIGFVPLVLLTLYGLFRRWGTPWMAWLALFPAVYFTLLHVIFVSSIRYRQPALLPLIAWSVGGLVTLHYAAERPCADGRRDE